MSRRIRILPRANMDLRETSDYIGIDSMEAGLRFWEAAHRTFDQLAEYPEIGRRRHVDVPHLSDLRQWPVKGFERNLIFYRVHDDVLEVIRVMHGARDIDNIFRFEIEVEDDINE